MGVDSALFLPVRVFMTLQFPVLVFLVYTTVTLTIVLTCSVLLQHTYVKQIIMHSMAEWYIRGDCDQSRLSRILDVAQDLKALSLLLNSPSFPFVIDLACLASRRGYLKLEKWLSDKMREHDEPFITAVIKFLQVSSCFLFPFCLAYC